MYHIWIICYAGNRPRKGNILAADVLLKYKVYWNMMRLEACLEAPVLHMSLPGPELTDTL